MSEIVAPPPSTKEACPSLATLCEYLMGRLPQCEFEAVDAHLAVCLDCAAGVTSLELENDPLVTQLRRLPSQSDLGEFELLFRLGRGGMGEVYKARHRKLGRYFAVKVVSPELRQDPHFVARFHREMESLGRVDSPHVVQAHAAGECDGTLYCALELIDGLDLGTLIRQRGALSNADAADVIAQAALGLNALHRAGLVHRDVHPGNLLLGRNGRLKIADLGLVAVTDQPRWEQGLTRASDQIGSKAFMAPEQWRRPDVVTPQADLFSLGCVWYYALTGCAVRRDPVTHEIVDLEASLAQVPRRCRHLLRQLLATDPAQRLDDVQTLCDQLLYLRRRSRLERLFLDGTATASKTSRRRGWRSASATLGLAMAVTGLGWWTLRKSTSEDSPYHPRAPEVIRERFVRRQGDARSRRFYFEGFPREQAFEILDDVDGLLGKRNLTTWWYMDEGGRVPEPIAINENAAHPELTVRIPPGTHKVTAQPTRTAVDEATGERVTIALDHLIFILYVYPDLTAREFRVSPMKVPAGAEVHVTFELCNDGTLTANRGTLRFFLNPQQPGYLTGMLVEHVYPELPASKNERMSFRLQIPRDTRPGNYFLSLWVDATETTQERDELDVGTWEQARKDGFRFLVRHDPKGKVPPNNRHAVKVTVLP